MTSRTPDGHLALTKFHALGNDFLVALDDGTGAAESVVGTDLARRLCPRHRGIGADGLILGRKSTAANDAVLSFRLWNADGSEAEMSGNGMRCLAHAALDAGWVEADQEFGVMTPAGRRQVAVQRTGPSSTWGVVDMGPVKVRHTGGHDHADDDGPCNVNQGQLLVDVGNPHLVVLGPDPRFVDVSSLGPTLRPGRHQRRVRQPRPREGLRHHAGLGAGRGGDRSVRHRFLRSRGGIAALGPRRPGRHGASARRLGLGQPPARRHGRARRPERPDRRLRRSDRPGRRRRMSLIERSFREKIVLVGVTVPPASEEETELHLDELALLVDTAGADEAARVLQRRDHPDPATFVGKGKAEELRDLSHAVDADTVVFDDELTPAQSRNLEKILGRTAIDRTAVILDIFAQNARTQEGKAQVELAQLRYRLPRLRGRGNQLSQQAGGIGTRGPGETQLEVDRRRLVRRMNRLESDLRRLTEQRRLQRKARRRSRLANVSLVGYTNAGKSTLLNHLTDAGVIVEDRLFATLDPRTRRLELPGGEAVLVSDTVGFVRKLPHQLVEAFRSTLEVVTESDLLVHVVDSTSPDPESQIEAVRSVLDEIGAGRVPELIAFNKCDASPEAAARLAARHPGSVLLSALTGEGVEELLAAIGDRLRAAASVIELVVPYDRGDVLAAAHREGEVLVESYEDGATRLRVRVDGAGAARFREFAVEAR
jgi:GTP-binding protein HflX